jgi:hypothetical protein
MSVNVVVKFGKARLQLWKKTLKRKAPVKSDTPTLDAVTTMFPDGYGVVVKLGNDRPPYAAIVLFTPKGREAGFHVCESLLGSFELDKKHIVTIEESP